MYSTHGEEFEPIFRRAVEVKVVYEERNADCVRDTCVQLDMLLDIFHRSGPPSMDKWATTAKRLRAEGVLAEVFDMANGILSSRSMVDQLSPTDWKSYIAHLLALKGLCQYATFEARMRALLAARKAINDKRYAEAERNWGGSRRDLGRGEARAQERLAFFEAHPSASIAAAVVALLAGLDDSITNQTKPTSFALDLLKLPKTLAWKLQEERDIAERVRKAQRRQKSTAADAEFEFDDF